MEIFDFVIVLITSLNSFLDQFTQLEVHQKIPARPSVIFWILDVQKYIWKNTLKKYIEKIHFKNTLQKYISKIHFEREILLTSRIAMNNKSLIHVYEIAINKF